MNKKILHKIDIQSIKTGQICSMEIHIGNVIKHVFKKSRMRATDLAQELHCDRSNIYNIFNRKHIDVEILWALSKIFKHNFFEYYSNAFKNEFPSEVNEPQEKYAVEKRRIVNVQVELTEREYQELISKKR
jgi:transcriptional regulator with XRE-family HTH domain